jgi:hypothetical protein
MVTSLILATSCAGIPSDAALQDARAQWQANAPRHYRMTWFKQGMIGESRVAVEVSDGKVISSRAIQDDLQVMPIRGLNVESVFDSIAAVETSSDEVATSYDSDLGYPQLVRVDVDKRSIDDEYNFGIATLEVL